VIADLDSSPAYDCADMDRWQSGENDLLERRRSHVSAGSASRRHARAALQLRSDAGVRLGYIVAVMIARPYEALVRWPDAPPTFESPDDLIDAT